MLNLSAGYIVFDGLETLEASIRSIRKNVQSVIVSYQLLSWGGTDCDPTLLFKLTHLQSIGLIDHLIEFTEFRPSILKTPGEILNAKKFELIKRQGCLNLALKLGATHYLSMDADECYREFEFKAAIAQIENESLDATAVHYINYVTPTLNRGYSRWKVPFIYRITPATRHHAMQTLFSGIDPTRGLLDDSFKKAKVLDKELISMHHMEMVRENLTSKYLASSRFFPNRSILPILERDVQSSKKTKLLKFTASHLGDTTNPREGQPLFDCENEFGI
jgi:hypothetical protein